MIAVAAYAALRYSVDLAGPYDFYPWRRDWAVIGAIRDFIRHAKAKASVPVQAENR